MSPATRFYCYEQFAACALHVQRLSSELSQRVLSDRVAPKVDGSLLIFVSVRWFADFVCILQSTMQFNPLFFFPVKYALIREGNLEDLVFSMQRSNDLHRNRQLHIWIGATQVAKKSNRECHGRVACEVELCCVHSNTLFGFPLSRQSGILVYSLWSCARDCWCNEDIEF